MSKGKQSTEIIDENGDRLISAEKAAEITGKFIGTIYERARGGRGGMIPHKRIGSRVWFRRADIIAAFGKKLKPSEQDALLDEAGI